MTKSVYTLGYSGRKMPEIEALVNRLGAVIFDIRFSPRSRAPVWSGKNFQTVFGARYRHVKALGNKNYKGGPIALVDFEAGKKAIETMGRPVILMCVCKNPAICHRTTIAERLRVEGFTVEELAPKPKRPRTIQLCLF